MIQSSIRSLAALAGLLLLGACGTDLGGWNWLTGAHDAPLRRAAAPGERMETGRTGVPGSLVAMRTEADDEAAVDARELQRPRRIVIPRTGTGGTPPKLNVLYVANGRIRAYSPYVIVRGTVDDDGTVVEVLINGKPAQLKDRSFSRRVAAPLGETEVVVRAEDEDGNATEARFALVRVPPGQKLVAQRPQPQDSASPEYRYYETASGAAPRLADVGEPGVYMILLAGTPSAHFVKMPSLAQCREAIEYTENAACAFHRGRD